MVALVCSSVSACGVAQVSPRALSGAEQSYAVYMNGHDPLNYQVRRFPSSSPGFVSPPLRHQGVRSAVQERL